MRATHGKGTDAPARGPSACIAAVLAALLLVVLAWQSARTPHPPRERHARHQTVLEPAARALPGEIPVSPDEPGDGSPLPEPGFSTSGHVGCPTALPVDMAAEAEERRTCRYVVRVFDATSRLPIGDARVRIDDERSVTTNPAGVAVLLAGESLRHAAVSKDGYSRGAAELGAGQEGADVYLVPVTRVRGSVRLVGSCAPAAGARIRLFESSHGLLDGDCVADAEGRFVTTEVPVSAQVIVLATLPTYRPASGRGSATEYFRLTLGEGATLAGRVLDSHRQPVPNVHVFAQYTGVRPPACDPKTLRWETKYPQWFESWFAISETDARGAFELKAIPAPGAYVVYAKGRNGGSGRSRPLFVDGGDSGATTTVLYARTGSLFVELIAPNGAPVARSDITLSGPDRSRVGTELTDAKGWRKSALPAGDYELWVWPRGWHPEYRAFRIEEGKETGLRIALRAGRALSGRIVDDRNRPLSTGAEITFSTHLHGYARCESQHLCPTAQGVFSIAGFSGEPGTLEVSAPGHVPCRRHDVIPGARPVRIVLPRRALVSGRLEGLAEGTELTVRYPTEEHACESRMRLEEDGLFEIEYPTVGRSCRVVLVPPEGAPLILPELRLNPGEERNVGTLRIGPGRTVQGTVVSETGEPVVGAHVRCTDLGWRSAAVTNARGRFTLEAMPADAFALRVKAEGRAPMTFTAKAGADGQELRIPLPRCGILQGRLCTSDGVPLSLAGLSLRLPAAKPMTSLALKCAADGSFSAQLPPGLWELSWWAPRRRRYVKGPEVEVVAGGTAFVDYVVAAHE